MPWTEQVGQSGVRPATCISVYAQAWWQGEEGRDKRRAQDICSSSSYLKAMYIKFMFQFGMEI